jgi:hypothetical protein
MLYSIMQRIAKFFKPESEEPPTCKPDKLINKAHQLCHPKFGGFRDAETYETPSGETYVVHTINCIKCRYMTHTLYSEPECE